MVVGPASLRPAQLLPREKSALNGANLKSLGKKKDCLETSPQGGTSGFQKVLMLISIQDQGHGGL